MSLCKNLRIPSQRQQYLSSLPIPYPFLIAALDRYYGITHQEQPGITEEILTYVRKPETAGRKRKPNMKILLSTFWNYPQIAGLQIYIATLKRGLEELGHKVDIIAPNHFPAEETRKFRRHIREMNVQFYMQRYGCYSETIVNHNKHLYSYEMMLRDMNLEEYDIFHAQDRFTANILGRLNQYYRKPLFFTPHGFMTASQFPRNSQSSVEEAYFTAIDRKAVKAANQIIILCEAFRPVLSNLGANDKKMITVYTGIDFQLDKENTQNRKNQNKIVITCIAHLKPHKGQNYLLEALALIRSHLSNVEVLIVGDGPARAQLEKMANDLELSNVYFCGTRTDIPELLSGSDIYVLPTTLDTLPISVIEAMFAGQAIITTNCGGIPEMIRHRFTGLIVEPKNVKKLADYLLLLLQNRKLREQLGRNARHFAKKHLYMRAMAKKIEKIYLNTL